jgi:hypothetical protein
MNSDDKRFLPPLAIAEAEPVKDQKYSYLLSLRDVGTEGADVTILATDFGTKKDRLQISIGGIRVVDEEFENDPPRIIKTRIPREKLLDHLGTPKAIGYMIRIGNGNGEQSKAETYLITH